MVPGFIPRIVLTGGPCAGKSTALAILAQKLPDWGIKPFFVPEVATLLITNGVNIGEIMVEPKLVYDFERRQISFDEKMSELVRAVCQSLGIPMPLEIERKFLIDPATDPSTFPVPVSVVDIRQTYLVAHGEGERRVRERREVGPVLSAHGVLYTYTEKKEIRPGVRHEAERIISATEYLKFLSERDLNRVDVIKRRYSFPWEGQYFELDFISSPIRLVVLEAELTNEQSQLVLPPFIKRIKEVTEDERYTNARIAAGLCPGY